jgi:alkylresorcinol/alkylpyrone synthase
VVRAAVVGLGSQVPGAVRQEELWERFFAQRSCGKKAERIWQRAGVETRHGAILPFEEDVSSWGTGARMRRFVAEAPRLSKERWRSASRQQGWTRGKWA